MITISTHAPRMIPSEHLSRQRAGMNGIFDLSLVKNISLGKRFEFFDHTRSNSNRHLTCDELGKTNALLTTVRERLSNLDLKGQMHFYYRSPCAGRRGGHGRARAFPPWRFPFHR